MCYGFAVRALDCRDKAERFIRQVATKMKHDPRLGFAGHQSRDMDVAVVTERNLTVRPNKPLTADLASGRARSDFDVNQVRRVNGLASPQVQRYKAHQKRKTRYDDHRPA
jgi:hypothetical protein